MTEFFVVGSFAFWALIVVELILLTLFLEFDYSIGANVSVLAFFLLCYMFGDLNIAELILAHKKEALLYLLAYVLAGTLWGVFKWYLFVKKQYAKYTKLKVNWLSNRNIAGTVIPENLKDEWAKSIQYSPIKDYLRPKASENKNLLYRWMAFWWVSIFWTLSHDFVKGIFKAIYNYLGSMLQGISDSIYKDTDSDFKS